MLVRNKRENERHEEEEAGSLDIPPLCPLSSWAATTGLVVAYVDDCRYCVHVLGDKHVGLHVGLVRPTFQHG